MNLKKVQIKLYPDEIQQIMAAALDKTKTLPWRL